MRRITCEEWKPQRRAGVRVLAVFAHPDDGDFYFGGTVARLAAAGAKVTYLCATSGDKGDVSGTQSPAHLSRLREGEQRVAAAFLGVQGVEFIGLPDGRIAWDYDLIREIVVHIRRLEPEIVLTLDTATFDPVWGVNHADHRAIAQATIDAVYPYARNPHEFAEVGEPHSVTTLLSVNFERPNCFVDIRGDALHRKQKALLAHASQRSLNGSAHAVDKLGRRETFHRFTWTQA